MSKLTKPDHLTELMKGIFDVVEYLNFQDSIGKRAFTLREIGFSNRSYDYYKKLGLTLPQANENEGSDKRTWVRPSCLEFIWLKTLEKCRQFGLEREALLEIKNAMFKPIDMGIFDTPEARDFLLELIKKIFIKAKGEGEFESFAKYLKSDDASLKDMGISFTWIELNLYLAIKSNCNVGLILTDKKKFIPFLDYSFVSVGEKLTMYEDLFKMNFIFINYWDFLSVIPEFKAAPREITSFISAKDTNDFVKKSIAELSSKRDTKSFSYMKEEYVVDIREKIPPQNALLESLMHKYPFSDLIIQVRDGKRVGIERIKYKSKIKTK